MRNLFAVLFGTFILLYLHSCVPSNVESKTDVFASVTDPEVQKILDFKDKSDFKSLYTYFRHSNPAYRHSAIMAFSSFKDESTLDSLVRMLKDPIIEVRTAAAFAIGQTGSPKGVVRLIASFNGKDTISVNNIFNRAILEAVGKTGNISDLKSIAAVTTYRQTDTLLLEGQALAIYRMATRNITAPEGTSRMVDLLYLSNTPPSVRLIAAHYIGRAKDINLTEHHNRISEIFTKEKDTNIEMAMANGIGKSKDTFMIGGLISKLNSTKDYRVKTNILRAFEFMPYRMVREELIKHVKDVNPHIAQVASSVLIKNGSAFDVPSYAVLDTITTPWPVRANMCGAVLANTGLYFTATKNAFTARIKNNFKASKSPYEKIAYINAMAQDPYNYYNLSEMLASESNPLVKTAIIEAQGSILRHPLFFKAFGNDFVKAKSIILSNILGGIRSGDVGQVAVASAILKDPQLSFKEWVKDSTLFTTSLAKLKLPRDIEAYNELKSCQNYFQGKKSTPTKSEYNHPINWQILTTIGDSSIAAVKTSQGVIRIKLDKQASPGSVANFLDLVEKKYFNNKFWHRVVPNFVIQTGCPRGDGYGSLDYTIRSELDNRYYHQEGLVGMASAGLDTEGTQWFITHSPTPHLDGNYTIFGRVVEGMDVVHKITQGDKIIEIIIIK
jgi:cyclophilin family peptidyl-prolyl cis-trans isomerase